MLLGGSEKTLQSYLSSSYLSSSRLRFSASKRSVVEVGLLSLPVGAEGVFGVCDCDATVVGLEEVERGGADPD